MQQNTSTPGHSCAHCVDVVLPGIPEKIKVSYMGSPRDPINEMNFGDDDNNWNRLGLSLADLRSKANARCDFAQYLQGRWKDHIDGELSPEAVQLFSSRHNSTIQFHLLICLQRLHPSSSLSDGNDLSTHYIHAIGWKGRPTIRSELSKASGKSVVCGFMIAPCPPPPILEIMR
jgi:hypothetical protein